MKNLSKGWVWAIVTLLVMNLALTVFLFLQKSKRQKPGIFLSETLGMNEEQENQFESLKEAHFQEMKVLDDQVRTARGNLFAEIDKSNKLKTERILSRIGELEKEKDRNTFEHFTEVRNILTEAQQNEFDEFLQRMMSQGSNQGPPPGMGGSRGNGPPPGGPRGEMEGDKGRRPAEGEMSPGFRPEGPPPNGDRRGPPPPRNGNE